MKKQVNKKFKKNPRKQSNKPKRRRQPVVRKYVKALASIQNSKRNRYRDLPNVTRVESSTGVNYYNKNKDESSGDKRMVIIDGSNVAYAYTNHSRFSPEGIAIAVRFFDKKGHEVKVVVPDFRLNESSSENIMARLKAENKLVLTPSSSYDDRFILQMAVEFDAAIISNDNFRELVNESSDFRKVIESRVIGYVFVKDMFMVPIDPYGRNGPTLHDILNRRN